jgi:hypothetical protein
MAVTSFVDTVSIKRRALARRTGSEGRRPDAGYRSAINSTRMRDSLSFTDSEDGWSGGTSGPPYVIAGIYKFDVSQIDKNI